MSGPTKRSAERSPAADGDEERRENKSLCAGTAEDDDPEQDAKTTEDSKVQTRPAGADADDGDTEAFIDEVPEDPSAAALPPCSPITPRELRYGTSVPEPPMPTRTDPAVERNALKIIVDELQGCKDASERINHLTIKLKRGQGPLAKLGQFRTFLERHVEFF